MGAQRGGRTLTLNGAACAPFFFFFLTLFKGGELEAGEVAPELGVAGCLLELPVRLGGVKLGGVKGEKKKRGGKFGG